MNWKKILRSLALFAVGMAVFAAVVFYAIDALRIARGLKPVVLKPSQDITEIIPRAGEVVTENEEAAKNETDMPLALPEGFSVSIFAKDLKAPRVMMWGPDGNLWTSIPSQGKIVALRDANGDGFAEEIMTILDGLNRPHGMASRCDGARCTIYIAESHQVAAYEYERGVLLKSKKKVADLPDGGRHFTRTLMFMPYPNENILLISVGSSCDVCHEEDARRAKILALDVVSGEVKEFAKGLRNSVFMAIHPVTGKIWATEMGRDMLGDDLPPDEINIIEEGEWYGWPWFYGKNIEDYNFSPYSRPSFAVEPKPSFIDIPAHSAPLGLAFFPEEGWPQEYWYNLLVAYHGSWNKREPTGYKIVRYIIDVQGNYIGEKDFISGWLQSDGTALGRPVDILIQPGGVIFVSDDKAGVIYRIVREANKDAIMKHIQSKADLIRVAMPGPGEEIKSPFIAKGEARGYWFFEASFPVKLFDGNGKEIAMGIAQAEKEWMTTEFVPFSAPLTFAKPSTAEGILVFEKDNPSGLPEHADALESLVFSYLF